MCGRFTRVTDGQQLEVIFELNDIPRTLVPQFNLAPTQLAAVARDLAGERHVSQLRWGLIPSWARDEKIGYRTINARAETLAEKPAFRSALRRQRCLVLADGFFEWERRGKQKLPHYFHMADRQPFAFAGLWERWRGPKDAPLPEPIESFTIVTTEPNELLAPLHDRMPAILAADDFDLWLDRDFDQTDVLVKRLLPFPAEEMASYRVSTIVNSPRNDVPDCIQPLEGDDRSS